MNKRQIKDKKPKIVYTGRVEGNQEIIYFKKLQELINSQEKSKHIVQFNFIDNEGKGAHNLVTAINRDLSFYGKKDKQVVAVFDNDKKDEEYEKAIRYCYQNKIVDSVSNMTFELWLILHKKDFKRSVQSTKGYKKDLIKAFNLEDCNIKQKENINRIVNKITYEDVIRAIEYAENIVKLNYETDKRAIFKIDKKIYYDNPDTNIHTFIKSVLKKCGLI